MEQVPVTTLPPETVHTAVTVETNVTGNPEVAVALNAKGEVPSARQPPGAATEGRPIRPRTPRGYATPPPFCPKGQSCGGGLEVIEMDTPPHWNR